MLVAGGNYCKGTIQIIVCLTLATAELYNPATGVWTSTGKMHTARAQYTATLLPSGKVLVAGGEDCPTINCFTLSSAELYDPSMGTWSATGSMTTARVGQTATLLASGKVLVAGGCNGSGFLCHGPYSSAELYDPATGAWTPTGAMTASRTNHTATLLPGGTVLVAGGQTCTSSTCTALASAEIYNPAAGTWTPTGSMTSARVFHTATPLPSGQVLATGGWDASGFATNSAEVYDPATGAWTATAAMSTVRYGHSATLLPTGSVLVAGA